MLKIYIGPNGYGKTYTMTKEINELKNEEKNKKNVINLNSEIVFADEMKDTVGHSFVMEYLIQELLDTDEIAEARIKYEELLDKNIIMNKEMYNGMMDEVLLLNKQQRKKDVIAPSLSKEYKKIVKINSDDLKNKMGSGQKLQFLLKLIQKSNKKYIFLDEPENHTHPSLLHVTAALINELSKIKEVCITTHSPELLSLLDVDFDNIFVFNDSGFGEPKKIDFNSSIVLPNDIKLGNMPSKSRTYYIVDNLKKNILEIHKREFFEVLFSKRVYLVEGVNDELFLKKLLYKSNNQYSQYSIFHCYGKPHFIPFINIFQSLGIEVIPLFDKDKDDDTNNIAINNRIKKCIKYLESKNNLENELGFDGDKTNTIKFIEFLDNYDEYEKYKYLVGETENV